MITDAVAVGLPVVITVYDVIPSRHTRLELVLYWALLLPSANICPMVWYLKSYKSSQCMLLSGLTSFHWTAKIPSRMHENSSFWAQKSKNFLGRRGGGCPQTPPPWGGGCAPSPEIFFRFLSLKRQVLVHSGCFLANPFHHRPFPYLSDWLHGLPDHFRLYFAQRLDLFT